MRRKDLMGTLLITLLAIVLAVTLLATWLVLKNYVVLNWQLFPRNRELLDLRSQAVTPEEYDTLVWKLPDSRIVWSVPFQGGYYDSDGTQELTITHLDSADVELLVYFPQLKTVHAEACADYGPLGELYQRYPNVQVLYTVPIGGAVYSPDTETVTLTELSREDMQRMAGLPRLKRVDATNCREFQLLRELELEHPQWEITYRTDIAGAEFTPGTQALEVTGATYVELSVGLAAMPELKTLTVHSPQATGEELAALREEYPDVNIHWDVTVFGKTYADDTTELDISGAPVDSVETAREIASKFPALTKLIVDSTGIDNEAMAAYREEVRSRYQVVWTIVFSEKCKARTDATYFMPTGQGEYYFQEEYVHDLKYLEDVVALDLGDHPGVHTIDFVSFMPHLKYLILAWTQVTDITPLQNCKELVYLELDHCIVSDYTPLLGCTALEDININDNLNPVSIEPLLQMTWLKTLWAPTRSYAEKQALTEALPDTRVVTTNHGTSFISRTERCESGLGWRNLKNYYDMRDVLGREYME